MVHGLELQAFTVALRSYGHFLEKTVVNSHIS